VEKGGTALKKCPCYLDLLESLPRCLLGVPPPPKGHREENREVLQYLDREKGHSEP